MMVPFMFILKKWGFLTVWKWEVKNLECYEIMQIEVEKRLEGLEIPIRCAFVIGVSDAFPENFFLILKKEPCELPEQA